MSCVEIKRKKFSFYFCKCTAYYWLIFLLHSEHDVESIRAPNKCLNLVKFRGSEDVLSCQPPQRCNQYWRHDTCLARKKRRVEAAKWWKPYEADRVSSSGVQGQQVPPESLHLSTELNNFISKDSNLHIRSCENLRSHIVLLYTYILITYLSKNYRYAFWPYISSSNRLHSVELTGRWTDRDTLSLT